MIKQCPNKIEAIKAAKTKLDYMVRKWGKTKNGQEAVCALCYQIDHEHSDEGVHHRETNDQTITD